MSESVYNGPITLLLLTPNQRASADDYPFKYLSFSCRFEMSSRLARVQGETPTSRRMQFYSTEAFARKLLLHNNHNQLFLLQQPFPCFWKRDDWRETMIGETIEREHKSKSTGARKIEYQPRKTTATLKTKMTTTTTTTTTMMMLRRQSFFVTLLSFLTLSTNLVGAQPVDYCFLCEYGDYPSNAAHFIGKW